MLDRCGNRFPVRGHVIRLLIDYHSGNSAHFAQVWPALRLLL
jgi:hypothetical protein